MREYKEAGTYSSTFDASSFSSGIYFAKLQSGENTQMRKMVLMK
ncbi:MAG: T9SS type A sorting domain-containing protein [Bacteroidota bacterium]